MPRDAFGNFTLPFGNPVVSGTLIEDTWANPTLADIAAQLNNVITQDGILSTLVSFGIIDGTLAKPGLFFKEEVGTGMHRVSAGFLALVVQGAILLTIAKTETRFRSDTVLVDKDLTVEGLLQALGLVTFSDVVTFDVPPVSAAAPTADAELVNKLYVDSQAYSITLPNPTGAFGKILRTPGFEPPTWDDAWGQPEVLDSVIVLEKRKAYHADTTAGALALDFPVDPESGDWIVIRDVGLVLDLNNITLSPGTELVYGAAQDYIMDIAGEAALFVFDSVKGWVRG